MLSKAREEAQKILQDAKDTADQTIRNINKSLPSLPASIKNWKPKRTKLRGKIQDVDKNWRLRENRRTEKAVSAKSCVSAIPCAFSR